MKGFKFWDKINGGWLDRGLLAVTGGGDIINIDLDEYFTDDIEALQSTGYKDINGNELHEKDFINRKDPVYGTDKIIYIEDMFDAGYMIKEFGLEEGEFEIVGNYYDNPELVEQENAV